MDIQELKEEAYNHIQASRLIEAIEVLKKVYDKDPSDPEILFNLAIAHSKLKLDVLALELLDRLLALDSGYIDTLHVQALRFYLLLKKEPIPDLESDFKKILEIYPESTQILSLYGYFLESKGREEDAVDIFKKIIDLNPEDKNAINSFAYLSAKLGKDLDGALKLAGKVLKDSPNNPAYLDSFAMILARKGLSDKAKFAYTKALNLSKDNIEIWETIKDNYEKEVSVTESKSNKNTN